MNASPHPHEANAGEANARHTHEGFSLMYHRNPPWETGRPQPPFLEIADAVRGPVLDAGCGTGSTSMYLAERGLEVTGVDFVEEAIRRAQAKASGRGLTVDFQVRDAMALGDWGGRFATIVDSGLFHIYDRDGQRRYAQSLTHVARPGARLYLLGFSDEEPAAPGGGVSIADLTAAFADGWTIESVRTVRGELNPAFIAEQPSLFAPEGPLMRFATLARKG